MAIMFSDFTNSIDNILNNSVSRRTLQLNSLTREKAFEIYILALIGQAVQEAGGNFEVVGIRTGKNPNPIVFRAAPGVIYSNGQDFAYLMCNLNNRRFEIHADVEFEGSSGATHEMDISLIETAHADKSRQGRRNPRYLLLVAECKFFTSSTPSIGLARALVGLLSDFQTKIGSAFVANGATSNLKNYLSGKNRPDRFTEITPLITKTEEAFVSIISTKLKKWASV